MTVYELIEQNADKEILVFDLGGGSTIAEYDGTNSIPEWVGNLEVDNLYEYNGTIDAHTEMDFTVALERIADCAEMNAGGAFMDDRETIIDRIHKIMAECAEQIDWIESSFEENFIA